MMKRIMNAGTRRIVSLLCAIAVSICLAAAVHAHSINGVDSVTSGKKIEFGSTSLTSGSNTVTHSLAGTPTAALATADYASLGNGSATTFRTKINGTSSVTIYAYDGNTGNTSTSNFNNINYFFGR